MDITGYAFVTGGGEELYPLPYDYAVHSAGVIQRPDATEPHTYATIASWLWLTCHIKRFLGEHSIQLPRPVLSTSGT